MVARQHWHDGWTMEPGLRLFIVVMSLQIDLILKRIATSSASVSSWNYQVLLWSQTSTCLHLGQPAPVSGSFLLMYAQDLWFSTTKRAGTSKTPVNSSDFKLKTWLPARAWTNTSSSCRPTLRPKIAPSERWKAWDISSSETKKHQFRHHRVDDLPWWSQEQLPRRPYF